MSETANLTTEIEDPPAGTDDLYEVVNGRIVEPPPMGVFESWIANALNAAVLAHFEATEHLGRTGVELLFRIRTQPNLQRRPDLAFISYERWPKGRPVPRTASWPVVPDLAVEIVSPFDHAVEILGKIDEYFSAGVRQVWVVYPRQRRCFVHASPKGIIVLDDADILDGGDVLPGFQVGLADLFGETAVDVDVEES